MRAGAYPHREQQPVAVELLHHRARRAGAGEQGEYVPDGLLHTGIRVEHHLVGAVVDQPYRQAHLQFAAAGLGPLPADQPGPDEVQLGLLCGPRRYADHATEGARGVGIWCDDVGIIVDA